VTHASAVADGGTSVNIPAAVIDVTASKASSPKIRACYLSSGSCANTATYVVKNSDNSLLPSYLVSTGTAITATPLNGVSVGDHLLRIVMTPTHGSVETYDMLKIVISCTIASINNVAAPSSNLSYTLYAKTHSIDLTANVYTQSPDCRFVTTTTASWTIAAGSPITQNSAKS